MGVLYYHTAVKPSPIIIRDVESVIIDGQYVTALGIIICDNKGFFNLSPSEWVKKAIFNLSPSEWVKKSIFNLSPSEWVKKAIFNLSPSEWVKKAIFNLSPSEWVELKKETDGELK
jgi:hypothetical protein